MYYAREDVTARIWANAEAIRVTILISGAADSCSARNVTRIRTPAAKALTCTTRPTPRERRSSV